MIAGDVMDDSASLLNDTSKQLYTYTVQIPFLNIAINELQETMEANNVPMTNETNSTFVITTAMKDIGGSTGPSLPTDIVEIQAMYERLDGTTEDWQIMNRVDFLPPFTVLTESLIYYQWAKQIINFLGATTTRDVRLDYIGAVIARVAASGDTISLINSRTFLAFRTAALCASNIGENTDRSGELNAEAALALERFLGINTKGRQSTPIRRRPFMAGAKVRSGF